MKFQYSKIWPIVTTIIFVLIVLGGVCNFFPNTEVTMTAITVAGSIELTTIVFYMKNSWVEKVARIKIDVAKETAVSRLEYNKEMLTFMKDNHLTRDDLAEVEDDSVMDELDEEAISSINSSVNSAMDEATASPEAHNV